MTLLARLSTPVASTASAGPEKSVATTAIVATDKHIPFNLTLTVIAFSFAFDERIVFNKQ